MSFVKVSADSHFPIENLPYGCFRRLHDHSHHSHHSSVGVAIGDQILDLRACVEQKLFKTEELNHLFSHSTLNKFMAAGRKLWTAAREEIKQLLSASSPLKDDDETRKKVLVAQSDVTMLLPAHIGDYSDFYASREHATNVGTMLRGKDNALQPNWLHLPVGYHGRASSIVVSGTSVIRPHGQTSGGDGQPPLFGPSKSVDFELEMGAFVGPGNELGHPIRIADARDHIFGYVLLNDWSARDVQTWEYVPLGPFLSKNFCTSISPWVVTTDALEPFRVAGPTQTPTPLPYLQSPTPSNYDVKLTVELHRSDLPTPHVLSRSNVRHMYWSSEQQLAHHTITGCNMQPGDLLGTGTISGPTEDSLGCMLELTWRGTKPVKLANGQERKFLVDGDEIVMSGVCEKDGLRIGFGTVRGTLLPALPNVL